MFNLVCYLLGWRCLGCGWGWGCGAGVGAGFSCGLGAAAGAGGAVGWTGFSTSGSLGFNTKPSASVNNNGP